MSKMKKRCNLCGKLIKGDDFHYIFKQPRLYFGYPDMGMRRYNLCDRCANELMISIMVKANERY